MEKEESTKNLQNSSTGNPKGDNLDNKDTEKEEEIDRMKSASTEIWNVDTLDIEDQERISQSIGQNSVPKTNDEIPNVLIGKIDESQKSEPETQEATIVKTAEEVLYEEKQAEPVFDGIEVPGMEINRSTSTRSVDHDTDAQGHVWPEKAVALKNFVKEKSAVAVGSVLRHLSGKRDEDVINIPNEKHKDDTDHVNVSEVDESTDKVEDREVPHKTADRSIWNPLTYIKISRNFNSENKTEHSDGNLSETIVRKGRIILYTRLGCQDCKKVTLFLQQKRLGYVEINIDIYPSRKLELEKISGSSAVPKVFFNEVLIGGLTELKGLDESGKLVDKIDFVNSEAPSTEAPLPPLSGEDDASSSGTIDELATVVHKMREYIIIKDRFYKMRRFTNCFLGSEAVDFISEDQYLEREEGGESANQLVVFCVHVSKWIRYS